VNPIADAVGNGNGVKFGLSLALSGDGNTLVAGTVAYNESGAFWVYKYDAGLGWKQQSTAISVKGAFYFADQITTDFYGDTIVVNNLGWFDSEWNGEFFVYRPSAESGTWYQVGPPVSSGNQEFAGGLALSLDGLVLVATDDSANAIAVYSRASTSRWFTTSDNVEYSYIADLMTVQYEPGYSSTVAISGALSTGGVRIALGSPYVIPQPSYANGVLRVFSYAGENTPVDPMQDDAAVFEPGANMLGIALALPRASGSVVVTSALIYEGSNPAVFVYGC